jgi:hypothetical protein
VATIDSVRSDFYRVPLPTVLTDATHGVIAQFELVTVRVRDADGAEGLGYTYAVNSGAPAFKVMIEGYLVPVLYEFEHMVSAGGVTYPEPDVANCGGMTTFRKVCALAEAHNLPVTSHGVHDLTVQPLAAAPNRSSMEAHGFGLDRFMTEPLRIEDGHAVAPERPGHGVELDFEALEVHRASYFGLELGRELLGSAYRHRHAAAPSSARGRQRSRAPPSTPRPGAHVDTSCYAASHRLKARAARPIRWQCLPLVSPRRSNRGGAGGARWRGARPSVPSPRR